MVNIKQEFWKVHKWLLFSVNGSLRTKLHQTLPESVGATMVAHAVGQYPPPAWQVQHSSMQHNKEKIGLKQQLSDTVHK